MKQVLVSCDYLYHHIKDPDLILLDASSLENKAGITSVFEGQTIKGARHFDLKNAFSDPEGKFPNTFPSPEQFEKECRLLGINNSSKIIVFDNIGIYTSPRVWWMFKTMGHKNVFVLDGGLPEWIEKGYETTDHFSQVHVPGNFTCDFHPEQIKHTDQIKTNIREKEFLLIDARSSGRFYGTEKEPRKGLRSGHIPNSINIPYTSVLDNGKFKSIKELREIFKVIDNDDRPIAFSCGSGITACIVLLAAEMVLKNPTSLYDGSWTEWATLNNE